MTARRLVLSFVIAGCSGVSSNPNIDNIDAGHLDAPAAVGTFDEELPGFRTTLCKLEAQCTGRSEQECLYDVEMDMADAKALLDEAGETRCARCMHVKTEQFQKILDAACDFAAGSMAAVLEACDLDPNDGIEKHDEACAGKP